MFPRVKKRGGRDTQTMYQILKNFFFTTHIKKRGGERYKRYIIYKNLAYKNILFHAHYDSKKKRGFRESGISVSFFHSSCPSASWGGAVYLCWNFGFFFSFQLFVFRAQFVPIDVATHGAFEQNFSIDLHQGGAK